MLGPISLRYKLRICRAILANTVFDVARRGVYRGDGLIVLAFGNGMRWVSDKQFGDGHTISELADGTTIDVQSGSLRAWAVDGVKIG
jgi:hypothetical protein